MDQSPTTSQTPLLSPVPETTSSTLPSLINAATKKQHTELNRLIIDRLPLALPPHASDPALLSLGLGLFGQIYFAFEDAWSDVEQSQHPAATVGRGENHEDDVLIYLANLRPIGLDRSRRLSADLEHLNHYASDNSINDVSGAVWKMVAEDVQSKPHVLIAYAWVMYMAIFSGGRWIRQQFADAGSDFWTGELEATEKTSPIELLGFTFLSFDGDEDGEDLKATFKARLAEAETLLAADERQDVVEAAQHLFQQCIDFVAVLDNHRQKDFRQGLFLAGALGTVGALILLASLLSASVT